MDIATVGIPKTHESPRQQPIDIYRGTLLTTLQTAAHHATRRHGRILASFTYLITASDSVCTFQGARQAQLGECFFWEHPVEQQALVGVGTELTIETHGNSCFTEAASAWRNVMQDAVVRYADAQASAQGGPVFFGGFAFDPLSARTSLWADFPDGLLILPSLLVSYVLLFS